MGTHKCPFLLLTVVIENTTLSIIVSTHNNAWRLGSIRRAGIKHLHLGSRENRFQGDFRENIDKVSTHLDLRTDEARDQPNAERFDLGAGWFSVNNLGSKIFGHFKGLRLTR
jgi:hypothetical protein